MKEIKDYKVISTKKGDKGTSKNYSNEEFSKSDLLFEALGNIDELSSLLGLVYHYTKVEKIKVIQIALQDINSIIATNPTSKRYINLNFLTQEDVDLLESFEEKLLAVKALEPKFVLPGSETSLEGAYFDLARSVARRVERSLVRFSLREERTDLDISKRYLNRLSDLLFIYARNI